MQLHSVSLGVGWWRAHRPALGLVRRVLAAGLLWGTANAALGQGHEDAVGALADVRAAIEELDGASPPAATGPDRFVHAARRAINDLVGTNDARYKSGEGYGGDMLGALGHLRLLTSHEADAPWAVPIAQAETYVRAAVAPLEQASAEDRSDVYQREVAAALADLETAAGRASELGAAGGISGALATTVLGVPAGAKTVPACEVPREFPSYGVAAGYLVFVAFPVQQGATRLPIDLGSTLFVSSDDHLIVYTAAETLRPALCGPVRDSAASGAGEAGVVLATRQAN